MKIKLAANRVVDAKVLSISGKTSNLFSAELFDNDGNRIKDYSGYVPDFFPDQHYGDYIMLDIDIETGQILNWKKPSVAQMKKFIKSTE